MRHGYQVKQVVGGYSQNHCCPINFLSLRERVGVRGSEKPVL
jgi:hypothetical protein